jgi:hypothetical protein
MALEDAVTLGKALAQCDGDAARAFALYESVRIPRTARIVWSTREMGRVYHAAGVERRYATCCGKARPRASFIAASSGCTAGKRITAWKHVKRLCGSGRRQGAVAPAKRSASRKRAAAGKTDLGPYPEALT